jgi:hypothetical protein
MSEENREIRLEAAWPMVVFGRERVGAPTLDESLLVDFIMKSNSKLSTRVGAPTRSRPKTTIGHAASNLISRFSSDITNGVVNRYTKNGGMLKLAADVSKLMSIINVEDKHVDSVAAAATCNSSTSLVLPFPVVAQGTTVSTRVGDSIKVSRLDIDLEFIFGGTAATATYLNQTFRVWGVRYKKTPSTSGATAFSISEFLNQDSSSAYTPMSLMNTDTNENFQVMFTQDVTVSIPTLASAQIVSTKLLTVRHECSFHQEYNGSAGSNICDNMIFLVIVAMNPSNAGGTSAVAASLRNWFIDN